MTKTEILKELRRLRQLDKISLQACRTIRGQAIGGDLDGAARGLERLRGDAGEAIPQSAARTAPFAQGSHNAACGGYTSSGPAGHLPLQGKALKEAAE